MDWGEVAMQRGCTEESAIEEEFMTSSQVQLENCHMRCCAAYVEKETDRSDWYVYRLVWFAA